MGIGKAVTHSIIRAFRQVLIGDDYMKPIRIHHVQITVSPDEVTQVREFYCNVMGLQEIEKPESLKRRGGFWMQLADQEVHVGVEDKTSFPPTKAHIAYQVDDLAQWRDRLMAAGIKIKDSIPIPGYDRLEFRDPFGNRVELIQSLDL